MAPASVERDTRISESVPIVPSRPSAEYQTATQLPALSVVIEQPESAPESDAALLFSGAAAVQVAPASVERAVRMSDSSPIVPPRVSVVLHTATQLPARSVSTCGELSKPKSEPALLFRGVGADQLVAASTEREMKMS